MKPFAGRIVSVLTFLTLAGCTSTTDALQISRADKAGGRNTGTYPTFSQPLASAAEQMSDAEAEVMGMELQTLADARKTGAVSEAEYRQRVAGLRKLARSHSQEAAREIEN